MQKFLFWLWLFLLGACCWVLQAVVLQVTELMLPSSGWTVKQKEKIHFFLLPYKYNQKKFVLREGTMADTKKLHLDNFNDIHTKLVPPPPLVPYRFVFWSNLHSWELTLCLLQLIFCQIRIVGHVKAFNQNPIQYLV